MVSSRDLENLLEAYDYCINKDHKIFFLKMIDELRIYNNLSTSPIISSSIYEITARCLSALPKAVLLRISPDERDRQAFLFELTWATDERFLEKLCACLQTQFALYLEDQIMEQHDLLLHSQFRIEIRHFNLNYTSAQFTVIMDIPSNGMSVEYGMIDN
ncbi:hypothetical protein GQX74_015687 [Glossina fuscipes]|nr:hypothetical protein GQX74_015687 [Glossina fuscipes]